MIDASIAAKWFLADEASSASDAVLERIENGETAVAPDVFRLEIQNVLLSAERNSRIPSDEVGKALDELRNLPIHLRPAGNRF
ncbi:MAG: type II toxin-antitoxin system VapC family toxin, partial [Candidatus Eremiobacteraeota bacterium]|nr:type II toxin-antitoxin system VapC family toxin [Candidatus Eremiobacteraeota bacterium]